MTPDLDLSSIEQRLRGELAEVTAALADAAKAAAIVELDQSAVGRVSHVDVLQQQRLDVRRRKLGAALNRLTANEYGFCCECEAPLDPELLSNDLAVVFCVDCQQERNG